MDIARSRVVLARLLVLGAVAVLPACGGQDGVEAPSSTPADVTASGGVPTTPGVVVPPQNSRSVSAPSAISPAQLRHKTCEDLRPRMDKLRTDSGQAAVDQAVNDAIANYPTTADWPVLTPEQQQAVIDGAHDSATGTCR